MSQCNFCVVKIRQPATIVRKLERIAKTHDCTFIAATLTGQGWQGWFAGPNYGFPFDDHRADRVRADIERAGLTARLWG